jgi:hypothetical protein
MTFNKGKNLLESISPQPKKDLHTMNINQKFHKRGGHHMTTLDVEQMEFTCDDFLNAQVWLEEFMLGDTQGASHALALCWLIELYERSADKLSHNK